MKTLFFTIIFIFLFSFSSEKAIAQTSMSVQELNSSSGLINFLSLTFDSRTMLYASRLQNESQYSFYLREKGANTWGDPIEITAINNLITPLVKIGGTCFNHNGTIIYFSLDVNDGNGMDIYSIQKENKQWLTPEKITNTINTTENESDPSISPDGNTFFFVRDILVENDYTDDYDCKKIMVSEKNKDLEWEKPYRLPGQINTGCVSAPRICSDNTSLIFSSVRDNETGFNVYSVKTIAKGIWSEPALIKSISTEASNIYPSISFDGTEIYSISQLKKGSKKESNQLYKAALSREFSPQKSVILKGKVTNLENGEPMLSTIKVMNPFTSKVISVFTTDEKTGTYSFFLNSKASYRIDFSSESFSHEIISYEIGYLDSNKIEEKNIQLYSSASVVLNIFDEENFQPLDATLKVYDNNSNEEININPKQLFSGRYKINLPLGKEYKILASKKNYFQDTLIFNLKKIVQFDEFEKDIELAVLKRDYIINIKDGATDVPLFVDVVIINKSRKEKIILRAAQSKDGKLKIPLREGDVYEINVVSSKGYAYSNTIIDLKKEKTGEVSIGLMALTADSKLELDNIVFETNSAELTSVSFVELDRVVELMAKNPNLSVEISAHTDNVGSDVYNLKLSERRAQSVVNYLTDKNANSERLIAKGYGEKTPIVANDTDENKAKNRRVELSILEQIEGVK